MQLEAIRDIRDLLLSERFAFGGHEFRRVLNVLQQLDQEEQSVLVSTHLSRIRPVPTPQEPPSSGPAAKESASGDLEDLASTG